MSGITAMTKLIQVCPFNELGDLQNSVLVLFAVCPTFTSREGFRPTNGIINSEINDLDDCQTECIENSACVAFGFDEWVTTEDGSRCYLYDDENDLENYARIDFFTTYEIDRCDGMESLILEHV